MLGLVWKAYREGTRRSFAFKAFGWYVVLSINVSR